MNLLTTKLYDIIPTMDDINDKFNNIKANFDPSISSRSFQFLDYILHKVYTDDLINDIAYGQFMTCVQYQLVYLNNQTGMNNCYIYDLIVGRVIHFNNFRKMRNLHVIDSFNNNFSNFWMF